MGKDKNGWGKILALSVNCIYLKHLLTMFRKENGGIYMIQILVFGKEKF